MTGNSPNTHFTGRGGSVQFTFGRHWRRASEFCRSATNAMTRLALMLLAMLSITTVSLGSETLPASAVIWQQHFGGSRIDTNTLFCLMAHGYFRSATTNVQHVVDGWLKEHPKAVIVKVVTGGPVLAKQPNSKRSFVWIMEGTNNLNLELVRKGCLGPETQMLNPNEKPLVPQADYDAFVQRVTNAGEEAKALKLGIWKPD
jgi:hypothetical protein